MVLSECQLITKPRTCLEYFWMILSTVLVVMGKRNCGCFGNEFRYFLIALMASSVGMTRRHLSFFSSQIFMSPRSKSTSLVRMLTTSETRSPTDSPSLISTSSRMFSIDERRIRICASVSARLGNRFRFRNAISLPFRLASDLDGGGLFMSYLMR